MESTYARAMITVTVLGFSRFFRVFYVLIWDVFSVGMTFGAIKKKVSKNTISFL